MKILFMGSQEPGVKALEELVREGDHRILVVSPPRTRTQRWHRSVHDWAMARDLAAARPEDVNGDAFYRVASEFEPDLILSVFYNQILKTRMLRLPRLGALNVHPSLLPDYRGSAVLIWALMNGEREIGITIHFMEERIDAGDIVLQRSLAVRPDDTGFELYRRVADLVSDVFRDELAEMLRTERFPRRPIPYLTQPFSRDTPRRNAIDWTQPAETVVNVVRALTDPLEGAYTEFRGERMWIWRVAVAEGVAPPEGPPGTPAVDHSRERLFIRAGSDSVAEVLDLGYAGQRQRPAEFIARHWSDSGRMTSADGVRYRAWREGDDAACVQMLSQLGWANAEQYARKFEDDGLIDGSVLIADCGGEVCGHSITALRRLIAGDSRLRAAAIGQVVVREDMRGRGIGRALLEHALSFADEHRAALVWLTAHHGAGVAYDMYRRRGFERVQPRLVSTWAPGDPPEGLEVRLADPEDAPILMRLRRTYARTTAAVQDREYDQAVPWSWYLVSAGGRTRAAVRVRRNNTPPIVTAVLFDTADDPTAYIAATARYVGTEQVEVHGSPASALVRRCAHLPWRHRGGEVLVYVPSLRRLIRNLLPFLRTRAVELGLRSGRVTIERGEQRVAIDLSGGEAHLSLPRRDDSRLAFDGDGLAAMLLGAKRPDEALAEGLVEFHPGTLPRDTAMAWLFPFRYGDFTQQSGW